MTNKLKKKNLKNKWVKIKIMTLEKKRILISLFRMSECSAISYDNLQEKKIWS